jgi:hypothetical protein
MNYQYPLVEITWDDASSDAGWQEIKSIKFEPQVVISIGFLFAENRKYVIIGHTYSGDDFVGWLQIPKGMIISRKVLKRAKRGT